MKNAKFIAAARHEFLAEVMYYNNEVPSLGARFTNAVEDATAQQSPFHWPAHLLRKAPEELLSKAFLFHLYTGQLKMALSYSLSRIILASQAIGKAVSLTTNNSLKQGRPASLATP